MKASRFYRAAAVLMVLYALGHTFGFLQNNPEWKAESVIAAMKSVRFDAQGFDRSYWDFFSAFGLFFTVFLLFAAVLAWLLASRPAEPVPVLRRIEWALVGCFAVDTVLTWKYAFTTPLVFSILITLCLLIAAWLSRSRAP